MTDAENRGHLRPWSPATYRIEVEGRLPESCSDFFPEMQITTRKREDQSIVTRLTGRLMDQTELTGMLNVLAELHLPILSVENIHEKDGGGTVGDTR